MHMGMISQKNYQYLSGGSDQVIYNYHRIFLGTVMDTCPYCNQQDVVEGGVVLSTAYCCGDRNGVNKL